MSGNKSPTYRRQQRDGGDLAFVELNGVRHDLGRWDTRESRAAYHRLVAEWSATAEASPVAREEITIMELCARFWSYAGTYSCGQSIRTCDWKQFYGARSSVSPSLNRPPSIPDTDGF